EAERISAAASAGKVPAKLVGGAAVNLHCSSARQAPLKRKYGDLDFVASSKQRQAVQKLFESLGYQGDRRFNSRNVDQGLLYLDEVNGRQIDVFIDRMKMCHVIELANRLGHEGPTLTPADLLLSKLQVYEVNMKDLVDTTALLLDHPIADHDNDAINAAYLARLTSEDWGRRWTNRPSLGRGGHSFDITSQRGAHPRPLHRSRSRGGGDVSAEARARWLPRRRGRR